MVASYVLFAAFYAVLDWSALKLLALAVLANVPFFFVPPFLHRYSDIAAATYIAVLNALAFLLFGLIVGSAAGMHYLAACRRSADRVLRDEAPADSP